MYRPGFMLFALCFVALSAGFVPAQPEGHVAKYCIRLGESLSNKSGVITPDFGKVRRKCIGAGSDGVGKV